MKRVFELETIPPVTIEGHLPFGCNVPIRVSLAYLQRRPLPRVLSFQEFNLGTDVRPYNVEISLEMTGDPEKSFEQISKSISKLSRCLAHLYGGELKIRPDISYHGTRYRARFSAPLSSKGVVLVKDWGRQCGGSIKMEEAPLKEKKCLD